MDIRIKNLIQLSKQSSSELEAQTLRFLKDPYVSLKHNNDIQEALCQLDESDHFLKGAFRFFIFSNYAEQLFDSDHLGAKNPPASLSHQNLINEINNHLSAPEVADFIVCTYEISDNYKELFKQEFCLHKVGTTSYIFKAGNKAIKCIKMRYIDNLTISQNTKDYTKQFHGFQTKYTPEIYETAPRYLVMDFISGNTLREHTQSVVRKDRKSLNINEIITLWGDLCNILKFYAEKNVHHTDLSPDNIIVQQNTSEGRLHTQLFLIDFGYNYVLGERVGTSAYFLRAQIYIAPELFQARPSIDDNKILADVYSLGVILLEMLSGQELASQGVQFHLNKVGIHYTSGLGHILEEMLDRNIETRLFELPKTYEVYDDIRRRIVDQLTIYENSKEKCFFEKAIEAVYGIFCPSFDSIINRIKELKYFLHHDKEKAIELQRFLGYAALAHLSNAVIIFIFFKSFLKTINTSNWIDVVPGYLVSLSFSILATRYYLNIFGYIETKRISPKNNFIIRINSFIFALPILYALLIDPKSWPYCSAIGVLIVAFNNYSNYKLGLKAKVQSERIFPGRLSSSYSEQFLTEYNCWWIMMAVYGLILLTIGIFLRPPFKSKYLLKDEWAYALIVVVINYSMYYVNATSKAPIVRSELGKLFLRYKKSKIYEEHHA